MGNALTRGDILGCLLAVVAFAPVLLAPGYCLGLASNILGFRSRSTGERLAWGVALSFAVMPIVAVMVAKYGSITAVCWLAGLCATGSLGIVGWETWQRPQASRNVWNRAGLGLVAIWIALVLSELVDVGVGNHLYLSVTVYDHALRTTFVDAVMRTGVPPVNPLYWPGHAAPMRYYYFWYVLTAVAARLGGVTARQAIVASVVWAGFGLAAIVALYCRHFLSESDSHLSRRGRRDWSRFAVAIALLTVTGLDILPAIAKMIFRLPTDADMEWWSGDQVTSWMDSLIWVPHHVAALVCCLVGFLLAWLSRGQSNARRVGCALIAGIAFASAFGLSIWVPLAFAMVLFPWTIWVIVWERDSRTRVPVALGAGLIAVLVLLPYLHELRTSPVGAATELSTGMYGSNALFAGGSVAGDASHLLHFGVRRIIDPDALSAFPWFAELARLHPIVVGTIARLVLLVPGYFVELGFYGAIFLVALWAMRRSRLDESQRTALFLVVAVLLVATFLRSTVISSNDFGWRAMLIAQFFLLLLAVRWCEGAFGKHGKWLRGTLLAMAWIGIAGTVYQAIGLRLYLPVEEKLGRADEIGLSEHAMAMRRGFDEMDRLIPKTAIIQFNTEQPSDFVRYAEILQARRQIADSIPTCASAFGGEASACPEIEKSVSRLFLPVAGAALSSVQARAECGRLGVSYLVATRWDGVWADRQGWVWNLPAAVDTGEIRVVGCAETTN
jgi:hypothetical protein